MSDHERLSPSGAAAWTRCAGKVREEAKFPEGDSTAASIDGTHTHTLIEKCIGEHNFIRDPQTFLGHELKDHEGAFTVAQDRIDRVKVCLDYVRQRIAHYGAANCRVLSESRVNPETFVGRADMAGTIDVSIITSDEIEIIDYKDGMNPVPAKDNEQLEIYGIARLAESGIVARVRMTIVQPKIVVKGLPAISSHEMTTVDLLGRVPFYKERAAATDDPNSPLTPGDVQCKYCRAKPCAAMTTTSLEKAGIVFQNLEVARQSANKDPAAMSDSQIREVMEAAPLLRQMLVAVEVEAEKRLNLRAVPGLKLVNGRGSRKWNAEEDTIAEKLKRMGVPKDSIYITSVVSPAQVEKLKWTKRDGSVHQLTPRQLKTIDTEYVTHFGGKLTVALESDSRPAVTKDASALFAPVAPVTTPAVTAEPAPLPSWLTSS